jgi:predicted alpha/beta hydrolase family esterase
MKKVFIIHGWGSNPEREWMPWLKSKLEDRGYDVYVPAMPDTDTPEINSWVSYLSQSVDEPDKNTYFIGHSIGCQTILRYLETINTPIGGALFVAGWFNLENLDDENEKTIARPWIETPIDIEKIKNVLPKSILIISDNDDYGAFDENIEKFSQFVTEVVVLPNAEHITQTEEPVILTYFENL